jgi:phosphoribosylanthranilate isomerase
MTWVKICGMTNLEDALVAVDAGADAVGFVFYEKSPRCVSVETARKIVGKLPSKLDKVGVFVNEPPERVSAIGGEAGLTAVQLHGDEYKNPQCYLEEWGKLFFALSVADVLNGLTEPIGEVIIPKLPQSSTILLDSGTPEKRGGTGKTFAWAEARWLVSALTRLHPIVVAGGLTASNVGHAAEFLRPWGVDVASGVEERPGKKDPEKVRAFVKAVRDCDRKAS